MTAPAVPLLRETLLAALGDAIEYRQDRYASCRDCLPGGRPCPDHLGDRGAAAAYAATRAIIASATQEATCT